MKNLIHLFSGLVLALAVCSGSWALTLTVPISSGTDDSEERYSDHYIDYLASPDLDLAEKLVGLRFRFVQIPQGATINSATLTFVTYGVGQSAPIDLTIWGEDEDWSKTFTSDRRDISDRRDTSASVSWIPLSTWGASTSVASPDLKMVVQEIVDRSGWSMGNPMSFIISGTGGNRIVQSYEGNSANAAILTIDYTPRTCTTDVRVSTNNDDASDEEDAQLFQASLPLADKWVGLRFQGMAIPPGATINRAYLDFATGSGSNDKENAKLRIYGEDTGNALAFTTAEDNMKDRNQTSKNVEWKNIKEWDLQGEKHRSPDISDIVQEIVGRSDWFSGQAMVMLLKDDKGERPVMSHDAEPRSAPLLHVEWECVDLSGAPYISLDVASSLEAYLGAFAYEHTTAAPDTITVTNSGDASLSYTITLAGTPAWISLSPLSGTLAPGDSADIAVTYASDALALGTYETTVTVDDPNAVNGAQTIPVSLTVGTLPNTSGSCSNVPLYVENRVAPAVLIALDLSGSMNTSMSLAAEGIPPQSPNLAPIVQEIVARTGWDSGNDMVFIVTGSGTRRAFSYDGQSGSAPRLFVTYTVVNADATTTTATLSKQVVNNKDDAEQRTGGGSFTTSSNTLDLGVSGSNAQAVGMRFQGLEIPQGATIDNAYLEFTISAADTNACSLTFEGEDIDDAPSFTNQTNRRVTDRTRTTASVDWSNVPVWAGPTKKTRLAIGQQVIGDIVKNRNINWGFGSWTSYFPSSMDYTKINVGCNVNDDTQQAALQAAIAATNSGGYTPFVPSMEAAIKYFAGTKADEDGGFFPPSACQDKFLIEVTDGIGNVPNNTSAAAAGIAATAAADAGISTIAVGFGIDDAVMINSVAEVANEEGNASVTDGIYGLHDEVSGVGVPFLAMNGDEFLNAMLNISRKIENRFTGSAPAPTTSADDDELLLVLIAEFGSGSWTGDLRAITYDQVTKAWGSQVWKASEKMPTTRTVYTVDPTTHAMIPYTDSTLTTDNYLCKPIGDIIDSGPVIVKQPNFSYRDAAYRTFYDTYKNRNKMVYVGANDGQLHAFLLTDKKDAGGTVLIPGGTEMWSFVPPSMLTKLALAGVDPTYDMCDFEYCHQYYVDGSPQAADIYDNAASAWKTILVTGLREGGAAYFALDVTDGEPMQSGAAGAKFLWEFTDTELGQTWGEAAIKRANDTAAADAKTWAAYFGSGYTGNDASQANKQSYIYGIQASDASPLWSDGASGTTNRVKISSTDLLNDALSGVLAVDKNALSNWAVDHLYTGNLYGDLFRVAHIGKGEAPVVSRLYESNNSGHTQPIRARPSFAYSAIPGEYWLYFGTGRYETQADKLNTTRQYFFGLKEIPDNVGDYPLTYTKPATLATATIDKALTNKLSVTGSPDLVVLDAVSHSVTIGTETKLLKVIQGQNADKEPWVLRLDASSGERVLNPPLVVAGVVFFTTFIPSSDACAGSGSSYLYAVNYETGIAPQAPIFDINGDGYFNDADMVTVAGETVNASGVFIGEGQASSLKIVGDKIFVTTTETLGDDGDPNDPPPPAPDPIVVNLELLQSKIDSWRDSSF